MEDGTFPVERVNGVPVVAAPEEIDITNAPDLHLALLQAAAGGPGTIVADMTRTRFCDSSGLQTLLAAHKRAQADGGELLLVIPSAAVLRIFALTAIDRMIPNFTSLAEALAQTSPYESNGRGDLRTDLTAVQRRQRSRRAARHQPTGRFTRAESARTCVGRGSVRARRAPGLGPPRPGQRGDEDG
jgi:anti-sigma B factor antagonist